MGAAAIAVPAAIKIGSSIFGALSNRRAINKAVEALMASYGTAGETARRTVDTVNPQVLSDAWHWGDLVHASGEDAANMASAAAERGIAGVNQAVQGGQAAVQPYQTAGTSALETLSRMLEKPQQYQYQADPGYQFRLAEGQKAINRMSAAQGASGGGGAAKALAQYNSGLASQEYGAGFNRFLAQQQQRQTGLTNVAGLGERAGEFSGTLGLTGAQYAGNLGANAAQYGGNALMNTTEWQGKAGMDAQRWARENDLDLGNFLANLDLRTGQTKAGGYIGKANIWSQLAGQVGGTAADAFGQWLRRSKPLDSPHGG